MISWNEQQLNEIINSEQFRKEYNSNYLSKANQLKKFLNSISLNKKYFRLTTNNKIGKNVRFKNKNISEDTILMKEINSSLNKLTVNNKTKLTLEIKDKIKSKDYLIEMIIENIIHKCIIQPIYNEHYIDLLCEIYKDSPQLNKLISEKSQHFYKTMMEKNIDETQSEYLQYCDKNKHLDLLIGYSLLITELEKKNILSNRINPSLTSLLDELKNNDNTEEKYKCSHCLYNIFKSYYGDTILPQGYIDKLNELIQTEKSMKIKFKLMDIVERK